MALSLAAAALLAGAPLPALSCQAALGRDISYRELDTRAVDGDVLGGPAGLIALRRARGAMLIIVRGGNFSHADFRRARLHNICFYMTKLSHSDWRGARAPGTGFIDARLTGADLRGAHMPQVLLRTAYLDKVNATGADFSGGRLSGTAFGSLHALRLDRANLARFAFACGTTEEDVCSHEQRISFRGADLSGAAIDTYRGQADWTGARLDRTFVALHQLAALGRARQSGPIVLRAGDEYGPRPRVAAVRLSPADYRAIRAHIEPPNDARDEARIGFGRRPAWARPGARILLVSADVAFDDGFRAGRLYRRLLPVIVRAASARIVLRVGRDGSVAAQGQAVGYNAHACSLGGARLRFDPATGWLSGPPAVHPQDPPAWRHRMKPLLRFRGDRGQVYAAGHPDGAENLWLLDHLQCGARAGFDVELVRIPAAPSDFAWVEAGPGEW
jgi:uncharacterized protein YjbI with pentapeptide repeats